MIITWFSFLLSVATLIFIGRKSIWVALMISAFLLGIFNITLQQVGSIFLKTILDLPILLMALSVGIIPLIGGALERSGLIQELIQSLNMRNKTFLALAPAFMGMLPMPGGALLSAPVIARVGRNTPPSAYAVINVWFRHILILIYPLGALLATTKMAGLNLYLEVLLLIPGFLVLSFLGYYFLLRPIRDDASMAGHFNRKKILKPMTVIIVAPLLHIIAMNLFPDLIPEIPLFIGVSSALLLSLYFGKIPPGALPSLARRMKPWKFFLLILGMFIFLNVFRASDASTAIAGIAFSKTFLFVVIGIFLGFVTGRVQVPVSIILPIFYARFGSDQMTPVVFAIMYFSIFLGYIISPIHPCVSVSLEYFKTDLKQFYARTLLPTAIAAALVATFSVIYIG